MSRDNIFDRLSVPPTRVATEMETILAEEHGMPRVRVVLDRNQVVCDPEVPAEVSGRAFAEALKRAIVKQARDEEQRGDAD